jgi:hypothetical protein
MEDIFNKYLYSKDMMFLTYFQKKNSEYYNLLIFFYLKKYNLIFKKSFYLSYFFDFRGRVYSDSPISPVGNKIFRLLYNYGVYSDEELGFLNTSFTDEEFGLYNYILNKTALFNIFKNLNKDNFFLKKMILTVFFEFGKLLKSDFIDIFEGKLSKKNFIEIGVNFFNELISADEPAAFKKNADLYIEAYYLLNILKNYDKGVFIKSIIYKDATASAIQLLMVLLGGVDEEKIKICNLLDDGY